MATPRYTTDATRVPQRIALFTGAYNHIADGVSLTLNRLVAYLERHGAEVRVFAPTIENPAVDHAGTLVPIPSLSAPGRPEYRISTHLSRAVRDEIDAFQPTLFHIATPDVLGYKALKLAQKMGVPVVASYHTHFSSYLKYYNLGLAEGLLWKYLRWFYSQCKHIYVPSASMAAVLRSHDITGGLRLWQRGVETDRFNPERRSFNWRHSIGVDDDEVLVTFIGRLVWEKGLHIFADVMEGLNARGIPHRSMIVGDGPARADLEARLTDTIFTGHIGGDALARAYASSDVFLFPSDTETFGNVTLEAMASGLPAVCADATGSSSLLDHGTTGYLAPPGDSPAFLDYVAHLVTDAGLRYQIGQNALEEAQQNYEWSTILGRIAGYYEQVLNPDYVPSGDGMATAPPTLMVSGA